MAGRNALLASDDDVDLNLSIPVKVLIEEFACPICFNNIKVFVRVRRPITHGRSRIVTLLPAGTISVKTAYLRYIHGVACLLNGSKCLNRKHQCPCCNKEAVKDRCVKNHHLDKLIGTSECSRSL